uniref:Uncharacterized protein n=1 Tax=Panagrellus redivivus TaxID=6233 RepID=A0A7E4V3U5_PANRE
MVAIRDRNNKLRTDDNQPQICFQTNHKNHKTLPIVFDYEASFYKPCYFWEATRYINTATITSVTVATFIKKTKLVLKITVTDLT